MIAFCTCSRFSASSIAMQYGASITPSVAFTLRRNGRQWLNTALSVSAPVYGRISPVNMPIIGSQKTIWFAKFVTPYSFRFENDHTEKAPFRQLATSTRHGSGGTGLGLPLTKALAEANRASFAIKSAKDAGTLVEVVFPRG